MEIRETCVLTFSTSLGGQKNVRINDPRPLITAASINVAAGMLTAADMFDESVGSLVDLVGAAVVTQTINTIV
jgi:hypothetical protein